MPAIKGKKSGPRAKKNVTADFLANPHKLKVEIARFSKAHQDGDIKYTTTYLLALGLSRAAALVRFGSKKQGSSKKSSRTKKSSK